MSELYYLQDSRSYVGDCLSFWGLGGSGYYSGLEKCQRYTKGAAVRMHQSRHSDIPLPASYIDQRSFRAVDCQLMKPEETESIAPASMVYVHQPGYWNGNDVYWIGAHHRTVNLDHAEAMSLELAQEIFGINERFKFWPVAFIESIARRIVHRQDVDTKKALRSTGIKLIKPARTRKEPYRCEPCGRFIKLTDFYGGNCPNCGATNY